MTLSTTETEYVALSEGCKEVKFVTQILDFLKMEYEKKVVMYVDNIGTIGMVNNPKTNSRTKHVDVRYHFVREMERAGEIEIKFRRSKDNGADLMTKNLGSELFFKHANEIVLGLESYMKDNWPNEEQEGQFGE